jgi:ferrous iron transport protein B
MGVLYSFDERKKADELQLVLKSSGMTPLSALSMMFFVLLYIPCLATVSAIKKETGSYKWTIFSIGYSSFIAWTTAFFIYQGGKLLGFE